MCQDGVEASEGWCCRTETLNDASGISLALRRAVGARRGCLPAACLSDDASRNVSSSGSWRVAGKLDEQRRQHSRRVHSSPRAAHSTRRSDEDCPVSTLPVGFETGPEPIHITHIGRPTSAQRLRSRDDRLLREWCFSGLCRTTLALSTLALILTFCFTRPPASWCCLKRRTTADGAFSCLDIPPATDRPSRLGTVHRSRAPHAFLRSAITTHRLVKQRPDISVPETAPKPLDSRFPQVQSPQLEPKTGQQHLQNYQQRPTAPCTWPADASDSCPPTSPCLIPAVPSSLAPTPLLALVL
jgi:hypothetical protein